MTPIQVIPHPQASPPCPSFLAYRRVLVKGSGSLEIESQNPLDASHFLIRRLSPI